MDNWQPQRLTRKTKERSVDGRPTGVKGSEYESHGGRRKKVIVVGLGMVGISFM